MTWTLISYLFILSSYIFTKGFYSSGGILLNLLTLFLSLIPNFRKNIKLEKSKNILLLKIILLISCVLSLILYGGLYQSYQPVILLSFLILTSSIFWSLTYFYPNKKNKYNILIINALIIRILMLISSPKPLIDVFFNIRFALNDLLKFKNPYNSIYQLGSILPWFKNEISRFTYLPGILVYFLPFSLIFTDHRIGIIFAEFISAYLIKKIAEKKYSEKIIPEILSLLLLYNPLAPFILEQSFFEIVLIMQLLLSLWMFLNKNNFVSAILFGFLLSLKQTALLYLPFFLKKFHRKIKLMLIAFLIFFVTVGPFFLTAPNSFSKNTLGVYWGNKQAKNIVAPINNALTVRVFLLENFSFLINTHLFYIPLIFLLVFLLFKSSSKFKSILYNSHLWMLAFFIFSYQAFANYFYLITSGILISLAFSEDD